MLLQSIQSRQDLCALSPQQLSVLCSELRSELIKNVSQTGGHLASNLGIVETTVALHRVFDTSVDRLVFDVGHQCYVHKLLTGRLSRFHTLRQLGGLSGFPKPSESVHDAFIAGHASEAVSVAYGMAKARTLQGDTYQIVALLGDGALTGGLAYEGLNNVGASREPMIVILNDNGMSIKQNVGAISRYLSKVRLRPSYIEFKLWYRKITALSGVGRMIYRLSHKIKEKLHRLVFGTNIFENLGFTYLGPIDGHDIAKIEEQLRAATSLQEPVLLHLITTKGKGYTPAEATPADYHGVGCFDPFVGVKRKPSSSFSKVFGDTMVSLAQTVPALCALTAAMQDGTGLSGFASQFPERFFDVGIAEEHAVCMAAGMANRGQIPVFAVYATFLQRGFDMLMQDVGLMQDHVIFAVDRFGLVGGDGETHQGIYTIGFLRMVPGLSVYCPASYLELQEDLTCAVTKESGPVAICYPRGSQGAYSASSGHTPLICGSQCTVVCYGTMVNQVLEAEKTVSSAGYSIELIKLRQLAPLDAAPILASVKKTKRLCVYEEASDNGCLADAIFSAVSAAGLCVKCHKRNLGSGCVPHGDTASLLHLHGLLAEDLAQHMIEVISHEEQTTS